MSEQLTQVFDRTQGPTEVRSTVETQVGTNDHDPWDEIEQREGPLAVGRMRLMGVYDDRQRNRFMLRIRIPGGQINADQLETVAGVFRDFGNGWEGHVEPDRFGEITTRQDIQVHWVEFPQLPEIEDLGAVKKLALRNLDRAKKSLQREYDPEGPLWISYTEHLDDYEGTEREAAPPPPYRSHHYTVAC